jgi:hypothetical protein
MKTLQRTILGILSFAILSIAFFFIVIGVGLGWLSSALVNSPAHRRYKNLL